MAPQRQIHSAHPRATMVQRTVAPLPWIAMISGLTVNQVVQWLGGNDRDTILLVSLTVFFPLLVLRVALATWLQPARRTPLLVLLAAIAAWSAGSISVNSLVDEATAEFPAPGEWLFMLAYLILVGYLLLDVDRRRIRPNRRWLDIIIICGGTACVASLLLVTPVAAVSHQDGVKLLLALIYPLVDATLALVVLGQYLMQLRIDRRKSWMTGMAFVLLAIADSALILHDPASTYDFSQITLVLWGCGFALLVAAATRPEASVIRAVPREAGSPILVGAGLVALIVLAVRPGETLAYYTLPPAILTMAAVAARLSLALRDANRANEAFTLSQTDDLTKLPNRRAVKAWLSGGLADGKPMALMLLDLDGFKEVNDSLGHRAGDTVLMMVAVRIREAVDPHVRVARLGGDEFAIILDSDNEIELMETAHAVLVELSKPVLVEGIEISPAASIGVTVARADTQDGSEVLRRADVAMYQAKNSGLGVALYDVQLDEFSRSRLQLAEELRRGLAEGQIEVWYQPQLDGATMQVSGLEALVRWRHPVQGVISPVSFLPAARRAGLMAQLSEVVVQQAVEDLLAREKAGIELPVAVNCAPPELLGPIFLPQLYTLLDERAVPVDRLVLEITEDSFLADPQHTREVLLELRGHGVQISIDDYGSGFSSLAYLRNLPVQELKIDRSLIGNIASDDRSRMIVASTIQLAHALGMRIVAEGVENADDLEALVSMGIDTLQGYHLARPMPPSQIDRWVREWTLSAQAPDSPASARTSHDPEHDTEEIR